MILMTLTETEDGKEEEASGGAQPTNQLQCIDHVHGVRSHCL